jgi:glycosyltransferase involved in cell wall biosynthesis
LLVPVADSEALAAALIRLLGSRQLRGRLARAGAELVAREFSVERMCQHYENLFQTCSHAR